MLKVATTFLKPGGTEEERFDARICTRWTWQPQASWLWHLPCPGMWLLFNYSGEPIPKLPN